MKGVFLDSAPTLSCDSGWRLFGGMCYFFNENTLTWIGAQAYCRQQNGDLVDIRTLREQSFLVSHLAGRARWIGLNDRVKEGSYVWNDELSALGPVRNETF